MNLRIALAAALLAAMPVISSAADDKPADPSTVPLSELVSRVHKQTGKDFILEPSLGAVRISLAGLDADRVDYPLLLAVLTMTTFATILGTLLADVSYGLVDPRVRYG